MTLAPWGTSSLWTKTSVSYLDVPYALEKSGNLVGHVIAQLQFIVPFHEVPALL